VLSHASAHLPGSIHEGGELGYSLAHATGAALDNPGLIAACVIGDGEAETGPLATSWHATAFLSPERDGAVLPILHLNGYKIANPTVLARLPRHELNSLLIGHGWRPIEVGGSDPDEVHESYADALDKCVTDIHEIQTAARHGYGSREHQWPMIVLRTPKGWTGLHDIDGKQVEGSWRSHQVPFAAVREDAHHLACLEQWMQSYRPEELFERDGSPVPTVRDHRPLGSARISAKPLAHGQLQRDLRLPDPTAHAVDVPEPGTTTAESTRQLGKYLRDAVELNPNNLLLFAPDEHASNRLDAVFEVTGRRWQLAIEPGDDHLDPNGRVLEVLSEHLCQGWLEGYLLTGRHGLLSSYEAFAHVVDSMVAQHAKWLRADRHRQRRHLHVRGVHAVAAVRHRRGPLITSRRRNVASAPGRGLLRPRRKPVRPPTATTSGTARIGPVRRRPRSAAPSRTTPPPRRRSGSARGHSARAR
jgi:xylulose-5-phosphate/fructose-6-phosphate phosphoketolase